MASQALDVVSQAIPKDTGDTYPDELVLDHVDNLDIARASTAETYQRISRLQILRPDQTVQGSIGL